VLLSIKNDLFRGVLILLPEVYKSENFLNSKEVIFLIDKGETRLRPLKILSLFDDLKNEFEAIDKSKISCNNISIDENFIFSTNCSVYSSAWESGIV